MINNLKLKNNLEKYNLLTVILLVTICQYKKTKLDDKIT